jgi:hypothetical protein
MQYVSKVFLADPLMVEVKYREHPPRSPAAAAAARAHPGRPVLVATKNTLSATDHYTLLSAHTLLWALG